MTNTNMGKHKALFSWINCLTIKEKYSLIQNECKYLFYFSKCLLIWESKLHRKRQSSSMCWFIPQKSAVVALGQVKSRNQKLLLGSLQECWDPSTWASFFCFFQDIKTEKEQTGGAGTWTKTPMVCQHYRQSFMSNATMLDTRWNVNRCIGKGKGDKGFLNLIQKDN